MRLEVLDTWSYSSSSPDVLSAGVARVCVGVHWSTWSVLCVRGCLRWGCLGSFSMCSIFNELKSWVSVWRIQMYSWLPVLVLRAGCSGWRPSWWLQVLPWGMRSTRIIPASNDGKRWAFPYSLQALVGLAEVVTSQPAPWALETLKGWMWCHFSQPCQDRCFPLH